MTNSTVTYNETIRGNLPVGISYDSTRFRYFVNGKPFHNYTNAYWYWRYLIKFGWTGGGDYSANGYNPTLVADMANDTFWNGGETPLDEMSFDDIFTTSRLGNATMVDSDGLLKWAPHNLLTYSEDFSNAAWTKSNATVTANAVVSPDGTLTATKIGDDGSTGTKQVLVNQSLDATPNNTISIFAKADQTSFLGVRTILFDTTESSIFDLTGSVNLEATNHTASIEDFGNGWYLCTVVLAETVDTSGRVDFIVGADGALNVTADGTNSVYIWGAHLYRSDLGGMAPVPVDARVAGSTTYVPTTSTAKYLPRRHNHVYDGSAWVDAGTLIEAKARTNLVTYSEDFSQWTNESSTDTGGQASPDGADNGYTITATSVYGRVVATVTVTADPHCFSVFVEKQASTSTFALAFSNAGSVDECSFDLLDGSTLSAGANISDTGTEDCGDFWRVYAVNTYASPGSVVLRIFGGYPTDVSPTIYGAQLEAGSTPSSYIPTSGSTVARAADSPLTIAGADVPWPTPTVIGDELVTNGGFDTDTSGWSGNNATLSSVSGQLVVTPTTTNPTAYAPVTLVVGKVYLIEATLVDVNGSPNAKSLQVGTGATGNQMFSMSFGTTPQTLSGAFVATATTGYVNVYNFDGTNAAVWDNISVKEINPLSVCIQMEGDMTYADDGAGSTVKFLRWEQDSNNLVDAYLRTDGTATGGFIFRQKDGGVSDVAESSTTLYSPGINQAFNIASRHGSTFINGAVDGTALTEDTTPVALPDLSSTDLQIAYDFMGNVKQVRVWAVDIGDTGIAEASS